jgi:hypothetical protein
MRKLKTFESFEPVSSEVYKVEDFLKGSYSINYYNLLGKWVRGILVDEKLYYLEGNFSSKKRLVNKLYLEVSEELLNLGYSESSIRKAIKNFLS